MKVHFAGQAGKAAKGALRAGVRYWLDSFYYLNGRPVADEQWELYRRFRHVIIDSGLFTLMFGSKAKSEMTREFLEEWFGQYVEFITPARSTMFTSSSAMCRRR